VVMPAVRPVVCPKLPWRLHRPRTIVRRMEPDVREYLENLAGMMSREFARINGKFDGMDARFDGIDARFDGIDARLDGIDGRLDGIDGRLDGIDGRLDGIDGRLDGIDGRLEGHDRRLDRLDSAVHDLRREMKSEFTSVRESIDVLSTRVQALERGY
jgi:archaellum component FlaC